MVFNATFNDISVISWRSVLLLKGTGENHRPAASHWQTWSCALNLISTFLSLPLGWCLCWWTISPRGYHPPSSQYFGTGLLDIFITEILQFLNNVFINRTKILFSQAYVTLAEFGYPVLVLLFYCSQNFKLFSFPIFRFWSYLMKVIPEM